VTDSLAVPDGLELLAVNLPAVVDLIVSSARWVHPEAFCALPVWYPETARRHGIYDAKWQRVRKNTNRATTNVTDKLEGNGMAAKAFVEALGARRQYNWTVCHIWGVDDPTFQRSNAVVSDRRYYSCVGNMLWLPTPLKGFTDAVPEIKRILRTCAFHLYGWACEHDDVARDAAKVRSGVIPANYPPAWPTGDRDVLPPGTAPFSPRVVASIAKRKRELRRMLADESLSYFPRIEVEKALAFWNIRL
jgi:hypothetical protein